MQFPDGGGAVVNTFGNGLLTMTGYNTSQPLQTNKIGQTVPLKFHSHLTQGIMQ